MELKKKVLGTVAAAALTLSMFGGVAAESDSVTGTVNLVPGVCKVSIAQSEVSFGTWTWKGSEYAHTSGSNVVTLDAKIQTHKPNGTCSGTIRVTDNVIPAKHFTGSFNSSYGSVGPINLGSVVGDDSTTGSYNFPAVGPGEATATLTLNSVPNTLNVGTYSGTIEITANAAN